MTDKELLELAAKAAGIELLFWNEGHIGKSDRGTGFDVNGRIWNPLTDDGDALRLAVKLGLCMTIDLDLCKETEVWDYGTSAGVWEAESHNQDPYAATRRAVVRAAAEIGKTL